MPRVTSGELKGRKFKVEENSKIRPMQDIVKQSIFSILGESVLNSQCLDLFAGIGSFGIEALSRGATFCDFVDSDYNSVAMLNENLLNMKLSDKSAVFREESVKFVNRINKKYDIVFADPYYEDLAQRFLFKSMPKILNSEGVFIYSHGRKTDVSKLILETNLSISTERRFGSAFFSILRQV